MYFSDTFAKSDAYCQPSERDGFKYILLCEVNCRPSL